MFDVVANALVQPIPAAAKILRQATIGNRIAGRQREDFLLQLRVTHRVENAARVEPLLSEQLDLMHFDLLAGGADCQVDLDRVRSREQLAERGFSSGHFADAERFSATRGLASDL